MDPAVLIIFGIAFNIASRVLLRRTGLHGIDAMPAVPIIAGYAYGSGAGLWSGILIAIAFYMTIPRNISYAPLTTAANALTGALASLFAAWDIFGAGVVLVCVYHAVLLLVLFAFTQPSPGYFTFLILNVITSTAILYGASLIF